MFQIEAKVQQVNKEKRSTLGRVETTGDSTRVAKCSRHEWLLTCELPLHLLRSLQFQVGSRTFRV